MAKSENTSACAKAQDLERRAFLDLIQMANSMVNPEVIARQLVTVAQYLSGCEAVAIRMKSGPGFPYAASLGFTEQFLALESDLCATDREGHVIRDGQRRPVLACVCGKVLTGGADESLPCFTDRGSFVATSTTKLLAHSEDLQHLGPTRNRCHLDGYETVALFPIRRDGVTYGLIQCNDSRPDRLTAEAVDLMENLATSAAHLFQLAMA